MRHKCSTSLICRWSSVLVACALLGVGCDIPFSVDINMETPGGTLELLDLPGVPGDVEGVVALTQMIDEAKVQSDAKKAAPSFVQRVRVTRLKVKSAVLIIEEGPNDIGGLEELILTYIPQMPLSGESFDEVVLGSVTADPFGESRFGNRVTFEMDSGVDFLKLIRQNDAINDELGDSSGYPRIRVHGSGILPDGELTYSSELTVTASGVASLF